MNFFLIKYAIFSLYISTLKFTTVYAENISHQRMTPAKVFTNFLKVPWINLNSSWKGKVTSACRDDITTLFDSANAGEMWALQMLDAASKIPAGIITGNIRDLGMYEECVRIKGYQNPANIQGRHCMVSLSMPPKFITDAAAALYIQKLSAYNPTPNVALNFAPSVCLPSSCTVEDIVGLVTASIQETPELAEFEVAVAQVTCSSVDDTSHNFTLGTILAISFFMVVTIFLVLCTVCDFVVIVRSGNAPLPLKTFAKFSLYTNAIKLLSTEISPENQPAIHGIRFLSMFFVVTIHRILSTMVKPLVNLSMNYEMRNSWQAPFVLILPYAVDTFFIISGFLMTYLFLTKIRSGVKINLPKVYLHRYLRLTPCMAALLLFNIFILPYIGSGPIWESVLKVTSDFCRKNWWTNLLYVQNFVNREQMCMPHTWYLAVEMQLFWISPVILFPLFHRPNLGLVILSIFLMASLITPAIHIVVNQYSFLFNGNKIFTKQFEEFIYSYTNTFNRALPYFIGVLLGYYTVNSTRKLPKVQVVVNWSLACIFILFCLWNTHFIQPNAITYNAAWEASYVSVGRLGWSLAVAWILYACTRGYGGPVARFLSLPIFVPLSRMSYCIYLVSAVIQVGINATEQTAGYNSMLAMTYLVWGDLATSIVVAFVMSLYFEAPIVVLEKIFLTNRTTEISKHPSTGKREKLLAILKQYPDSTNGRVCYNPATQTGMLQSEFWRTVSELLNTSSKKESKTPTELAKTWQDLKSDLLKNDCQSKSCAYGINIGSAQFETGINTLEKELLIFLVAVSCNLDNVSSNEESRIANPTRSQLHSGGLKNEDPVRISTIYLPASAEETSKSSGSTLAGYKYPPLYIESSS